MAEKKSAFSSDRQSRRRFAGDDLAPVDGFDPAAIAKAIPNVVRKLVEFGRAQSDPYAGGEGPSFDTSGVRGGASRDSSGVPGMSVPAQTTQAGPPMGGVQGGGSNTDGVTVGAPSPVEGLLQRYPALQGFSGRVGTTAAEREGSAFGSGRGRTRVPMGGEIQFNEDDARRPDQLARQAYQRSEEDRDMKQRAAELAYAQQVSEARARMGFEEEFGIPYDPQIAKYVAESNQKMVMDDDMKTGAREMFAAYERGDFDDPSIKDPATRQAAAYQAYQKSLLEGAIKWGARVDAPEGYFRSLQAAQGVDAILGQ